LPFSSTGNAKSARLSDRSENPAGQALRRLRRPLGRRRLASWTIFSVLLASFLLVPLVASLSPEKFADLPDDTSQALLSRRPDSAEAPAYVQAAAIDRYGLAALMDHRYPPPTAGALDRWWTAGPLAAAHQPWANDCKVCHSKPFERVQDSDCLGCHKVVHDHVDRTRIAVDALEVRCASCHRDHKGPFALAAQNRHRVGSQCGACHEDIKAHYPQTTTEDVADFATAHPEFRVQVFRNDHLHRERLPAAGQLVEPTGLRFPHDVHVAEEGIRSPAGIVNLTCATCHEGTADGAGFLPVTMAKHCQDCHALRFEPALPNREVPHGPVEAVLDTLREFYAYVALAGVQDQPPLKDGFDLRRPSGAVPSVESFINPAADPLAQAAAAAVDLFENRACAICHEVERLPGPGRAGSPGADLPQWHIVAVTPQHAFMPRADFDHRAHGMVDCQSCHAAAQSTAASDLLMPGIAGCRDCHAGASPSANKVTSDCGLCHAFHQSPLAGDSVWPVSR
jgi:predicted CXXCH cytochrome family protein